MALPNPTTPGGAFEYLMFLLLVAAVSLGVVFLSLHYHVL